MIIYHTGKAPTKAHDTDIGYDLVATKSAMVPAGATKVIPTGLCIDLPYGVCGMVVSRSGLAAKRGVFVLNSPGIVDPGYRGEVCVILHNASGEPYQVKKGDRIAQLVFVRTLEAKFDHVDELPGIDDRGTNGFGSTGR